MMWISFAWTTKAFLAGTKTVTRRFWNKEYMEKWWKVTCENNGLAVACDRSPRWGGKQIGHIKVTLKPYLQKLKFVTDADEIKEGHLWGNAKNFIEMMGGPEREPYVIELEPILTKKEMPLFDHEDTKGKKTI